MSAERQQIRKGGTVTERSKEGHGQVVSSPFPDGSRLVLNGKDSSLSVQNDTHIITLTQESITNGDSLGLKRSISEKVRNFPVLGKVFIFKTADYAGDTPYSVCTLPTVSTANKMSKDIFDGLSTAGIELLQTSDMGDTPVEEYVAYLRNGQLAVSLDPKIYLHDLFFHWLGVASIQEREFEVFKALCDDIDQIGSGFGEETKKTYITSLGDAFDLFTAFILVGDENKSTEPQFNLPDVCLAGIAYNCHEVLSRSQHIVDTFDTESSPLIRSLVKSGAGSKHYGEVAKRLMQDPWVFPSSSSLI